jgi:capsular polysaccharide biosynthesis protein
VSELLALTRPQGIYMIKWLKNHWLLTDGTAFRHWRVVPESMVLTGHGRIWLHNWKGLLQLWVRLKWARLPTGTVYASVHNSYRGYYHWLVESLPKLLEVQRQIPEFTLLLPDTYNESFYEATLRLLAVTKVESLAAGRLYAVPTLALPYGTEGMGDYTLEKLLQVKLTLLRAVGAGKPSVGPPKRLYISRRQATRRKVLNEVAIEQLLANYGFESVCFEDYSFEEQLRLCASADALIGIHGAGLTNMLFLPSQSVVVEFRKFDNGHNYFFTQLAAVLQHQYELLYCLAPDEQQSVQDADLEVSVIALTAVLHQRGLLPINVSV